MSAASSMVAGYSHAAAEQLKQLASDVARLCHACQAVLRCDGNTITQWDSAQGPRFVIACGSFHIGGDAFALEVFDLTPRQLTPVEDGSFQALTGMFRRQLEFFGRPNPGVDEAWVQDHVAVAVDYVTDSFVLLRNDWTIQHVNTQLERMVNKSRTELLGRTFWDAFPLVLGTTFETEIRAAMTSTEPRVFEQRSEITHRWFQSRAFPSKEGLVLLTTDVTERKNDELARVEAALKTLQSQRMESLGTLAGGIAHDFNNILGAILGHVGLLEGHVPPSAAGRESVEQIALAGRRARDLVQQILTFSRATTREFLRQPLRPMVEEAVRMLRSTLPFSVEVNTVLTDRPMTCTLNPMEVQQLLVNLGTNASHALPAHVGRITIEVGQVNVGSSTSANVGRLEPGDYAEIVVSDTGGGMSAETLLRLFEPFYTTKRRGQGTGLGLHVVSSIVKAHGGAIRVKSSLGAGSAFHVYVPAFAETDAEVGTVSSRTERTGRGERVALVDDDELVRLMVQRVLEQEGFSVSAFSDPGDFIGTLSADPGCFDLLVTDYCMPGMNGLELARAARQQRPDLAVIIATGFMPDELRAEVEALGDAEILNKEQTFEELGLRASRALRKFPSSEF